MTIFESIAAWHAEPTDEHARAYHEIWTRQHQSGAVSSAMADWFYCCQPQSLWVRLYLLGLSDEWS